MEASFDAVTALFLEELRALDAFAGDREAEGRLLPAREDPDVRRILEALAFFSARTRAAAASSTRAAVRRIAAGTLDDLLPVAPASLLVAAQGGDQLPEPVSLPAGTQLRITAPDRRVGMFCTEHPLTVLPAEIEGAALIEKNRALFLRVQIAALRVFRGPRLVSLHVRRFNDYRASLALHDALEQHAVRAFVTVNGRDEELPCRVSFGEQAPRRVEDETGEPGALARTRAFFHMPDRELFLHIEVPVAAWGKLAVHLELDASFPGDLSVTKDAFHLSVAPTSNVWADFAEPILCDGTQDTYPIRHPSPLLQDVKLHAVRGVFRSSEAGLAPILPAALSQEEDAFEVEEAEDGGPPQLRLRLARAFNRPIKVVVDARWSQPDRWSTAAGRLVIMPQTRELRGVTFAALGPMRRPEESSLASDPARVLDLLSLRMRPTLGLRDLAGVLSVLGTTAEGPYRGAHAWIDDLSASDEPDPAQLASGVRHRYGLAVRQRGAEDAPLARRLVAQVASLLQAWTEDPVHVEPTIVAAARPRVQNGMILP